MGKIKNKLIDWKNRLKDRHMLSIIVVLFTIIVILGIVIYKKQTEYRQASENQYNMAFYELVDYVQNVETYLAKSLISSSPEHGAETLTHVWREANLAQAYLSRLPIDNVELEKTSKFLNQVSDYSYSLSRKNIYKKALTDEDLNNLEELHNYSVDLKNTLDQLSADINGGRIKWGELTKKGEVAFAQEVSNISKNSFSNLEENFHEYSGLIYDGAFSEHMTSSQKKGLTGDNIDEEKAKQIAIDFIGKDRVQAINFNGKSENTDIITYDFSVKVNSENEENMNISITEKGGHVLLMNYNRNVEAELISQEEADKKGKEFLESRGLNNMKETYYLKQDGIVTINYAYKQDEVTVYPDLIKLKVALDNGEIMGIETKGYLNSHEKRKIDDIKVSKEKAKEGLNKNLEIISENLAIIPTEWKTEVLCWEFKGKVNDTDFLVYINAENGKEEDIYIYTTENELEKLHNHGIYENIYKMNKLDFYNLYSGQKVQLNGDKCELYNGEIDIKSDDAWYKLDDLYGVLRDNENTNFVVQKITDDKIYLTHENGSGSIYTYKELYPDFNVGDIVKRVNGKYIK